MEALCTPDFTMATPNGVAAARRAASGYALRALPRSEWHKTYTTSWDINRRRAHARNTFRLSVNHSVNERGAFPVSCSTVDVVSDIVDSRNIWSSPTIRRRGESGNSGRINCISADLTICCRNVPKSAKNCTPIFEGERLLMRRDRNWIATHWNVKEELQNYNCAVSGGVSSYVSPGIGG